MYLHRIKKRRNITKHKSLHVSEHWIACPQITGRYNMCLNTRHTKSHVYVHTINLINRGFLCRLDKLACPIHLRVSIYWHDIHDLGTWNLIAQHLISGQANTALIRCHQLWWLKMLLIFIGMHIDTKMTNNNRMNKIKIDKYALNHKDFYTYIHFGFKMSINNKGELIVWDYFSQTYIYFALKATNLGLTTHHCITLSNDRLGFTKPELYKPNYIFSSNFLF